MTDNWKTALAIAAVTSLIVGGGYFLRFREIGKGMEQQQELREMMKNRPRKHDNRQH